MNKELKKIAKEIKGAKKIALFTHISPDCDALGSVFALYNALTGIGKKVEIYSKDNFTSTDELLFDLSVVKSADCDAEKYDLFIACDVSTLKRLGDYAKVFKEKENTVLIDHHHNSEQIGKYNFVNPQRSSCCEIVFDLLQLLKIKISSIVASNLYCGLSSDTNSFINSNTNVLSFETAHKLIEFGADIGKLNELLYHTRSKKSLKFKSYLWNNYKIKDDIAYILMPYEELHSLKGKKSDCDGYSHSLITIQGVNYSFSIVEEIKGFFNISMRSKANYDVRAKAEKLGGGGHICASGARFNAKSINEAKNKVLKAIKDW